MWIVRIALTRPYTFIVAALVILLMTPIVLRRTPTDIFPDIDIPVVSVAWNYNGLSPQQMEDRIVTGFERFMTKTVDNIEHTESQTVAGRSVTKVFFQPGTDVHVALTQITAISQSVIRGLPPGIAPPIILNYSASAVPVLQLGMNGQGLSEQQLFDFSVNTVGIQLATVPGTAVPFPFGGKPRQVSVNIDIPALQAKGLSPVDVINAISTQNLALPSGSVKLGPTEYNVEMNGSTNTIAALNNVPIRTTNGATIYVRDVAYVSDGFSPQINIARMDGQRGVMVAIYKIGGASTLDVVSKVYAKLPHIASLLPPQLKITPLFDQSIFVRAAVQGVVREALLAACLTALMILLFLGSWRSTLIIAVSIPLSILVSIFALSALHETINLMTLGGLALAVGILVDDATVEIENINRNLGQGKETTQAILDGAQQIAVPAFVSTLAICIVFVPMFFLTGVAKFLFVPLAEAVVFAMLASYVLSRTLVPTLAMYLLKGQHGEEHATGNDIFSRVQRAFTRGFDRMRGSYRASLAFCLERAWLFVVLFLAFCAASMFLIPSLGRDFFPSVDAGLIRLHMRARAGQRVEETARETDQVDRVIRSLIPPGDLGNILDNIGLFNSTINMIYSNSGVIGESDAEILISLKPGRKRPTRYYVDHLREHLAEQFPGTQFFFQPADMISQILNFGVPAPIDIQLIGANERINYQLAQNITKRLQHIPGAVDVHVHQLRSSPTLFLDVDRSQAQSVGLSQQDVANSVLLSLSSSFQINPSFWVNPANGNEYNVTVQVPQYKIDSLQALNNIPVSSVSTKTPQVLGNLAALDLNVEPAVVSHYDAQPMIDVYASVEGRDLGGVVADVENVLNEFQSKLPRGSLLELRGQVATMASSFAGLTAGVGVAVVLVYLLIVVNFQSWLDPFIIISALPGALAGIVWMLLLTHTTLSVPSLTGMIMCMGVATANSILMVSFARERLSEGRSSAEAALQAGFVRLRPVLMTALAMIIGMVPLSLAFGEGGEQNAPLGRSVIGGLIVATFATLYFVPCVFSLVHKRRPGGQRTPQQGPALPIGGMNSVDKSEISQNVVEQQDAPRLADNRGSSGRGVGALLRWSLILFLIFLIAGIYVLSQRATEHKALAQQTEQMAVPYVSVIHATPIDADSEMVLPGTLKPFIESPIYARTNGYLKKWYKDIGSHVEKGEILAEIDTPEIDQQLAQARADLVTAKANLSLSNLTAARYQDLIKSDSVSRQDLDNANGDLAARTAMAESAEANVKRLEEMESFKHVYAPFTGIITQRDVDPGTLINAGNGGAATKEMFDLAQIDPMRVYVAVPQAYSPSIRPGLKACLSLRELRQRNFCGQVVRTANSIDLNTRTLLTEVDVPNASGALLPGAYAEVHFDVKVTGQLLSLPINALLFRPDGPMAAVVGPDSRISLKKITIGRDFGNSVEVLQGIDVADRVVINPPDAQEQNELVAVTPQAASGN